METQRPPGRIIAGCFGLLGFATAVMAGVWAGNPSETVLLHGIIAMALCRLVGMGAGHVGEHVVQEHLDRYRIDHPIPDAEQEEREFARSLGIDRAGGGE